MYVFYSFKECHYLKRTKIEIKLKSEEKLNNITE